VIADPKKTGDDLARRDPAPGVSASRKAGAQLPRRCARTPRSPARFVSARRSITGSRQAGLARSGLTTAAARSPRPIAPFNRHDAHPQLAANVVQEASSPRAPEAVDLVGENEHRETGRAKWPARGRARLRFARPSTDETTSTTPSSTRNEPLDFGDKGRACPGVSIRFEP